MLHPDRNGVFHELAVGADADDLLIRLATMTLAPSRVNSDGEV